MSSHFVGFVAEDEDWNFLLDNARLGQNIIQVPFTHKEASKIRIHYSSSIFMYIYMCENHMVKLVNTLNLHGTSVRILKHPPQKLSQLPEARTHPVWAADENDQEHQQHAQALFCPSVKDRKRAHFSQV